MIMKDFATLLTDRKERLIRALSLMLPMVMLTMLLSQTVFARNTYVITDGERVHVHTSYASDPAAVLDEAGVELSENDFYTTQESDGVSEITVQRSQIVTVENCGETLEVTSYGEPVQALLQRLGIPCTGEYQVDTALDAMTYDGMKVQVDWLLTSTESYTVELPYETETRQEPSLPEGQETVLQEGKNGQAICTAQVSYKNARETGRELVEQTVTVEPQNRIVLVGTGEAVGAQEGPVFGDGYIVLTTGEVLTYTHTDVYKATAYTSWIEDVTGTTATGTKARVGAVAVDPDLIPYGTRMFIVTNDGQYIYGIATAEDCGGGVNGKHIDLFFDTVDECFQFGVRNITIYFLGDADWRGPQNRG